jgi:hypothetical protein
MLNTEVTQSKKPPPTRYGNVKWTAESCHIEAQSNPETESVVVAAAVINPSLKWLLPAQNRISTRGYVPRRLAFDFPPARRCLLLGMSYVYMSRLRC